MKNDNTNGNQSSGIDHTDPEVLERLYWDEGLTLGEIGEGAGVSEGAVWHHMDKHGIDTRGEGEGNVVPWASFYTRKDGYEVWDIDEGTVPVHRLLAVAEYGFEAVAGNDVHHRRDIKWLNVPWNLEPLTRKEHIREHSEFSESDIREIRRLKEQGLYDREIADRFDTKRSTVNSIVNGVVWKDA